MCLQCPPGGSLGTHPTGHNFSWCRLIKGRFTGIGKATKEIFKTDSNRSHFLIAIHLTYFPTGILGCAKWLEVAKGTRKDSDICEGGVVAAAAGLDGSNVAILFVTEGVIGTARSEFGTGDAFTTIVIFALSTYAKEASFVGTSGVGTGLICACGAGGRGRGAAW